MELILGSGCRLNRQTERTLLLLHFAEIGKRRIAAASNYDITENCKLL